MKIINKICSLAIIFDENEFIQFNSFHFTMRVRTVRPRILVISKQLLEFSVIGNRKKGNRKRLNGQDELSASQPSKNFISLNCDLQPSLSRTPAGHS